MEEVTGEPLYRDRVCGIEIGKAGMVATIRVPSDRTRRSGGPGPAASAPRKEVLALAGWLWCLQVPAVGAGGDYWSAYGPIAHMRLVRNYLGAPRLS